LDDADFWGDAGVDNAIKFAVGTTITDLYLNRVTGHDGAGAYSALGTITALHASDNIGISGIPSPTVYKDGGTDVPIADGGTGASTAAGALTNFGLSANAQKMVGASNGGGTMSDDTVQAVAVGAPNFMGVLQIMASSGNGALILVRTTASANAVIIAQDAGALFEVGTGIPTGTTGTNNKVRVSPHTDGNVYIENRAGTLTLRWAFIGG
jgi:hypothetical protein